MAIQYLQPKGRPATTEPSGDAPAKTGPKTGRVSRRRPKIRWVPVLLILLALAAGGAGTWALLRPVPVTLGAATRGEAVDAVYASGVVEYVRQARVAPVVTAPIRQVAVIEGQTVKGGQTLAQLDDGPQMGTTLQLESQAALARAAAARQARLFAAGFGARAANEDAQQQVKAAEAAARGARAHLEDYRVKAPFAGRVLRRDAEPGDLATVGKPLFVVADPGSLRVTADVDERDVGRLAAGYEAVIRSDAYPGRTFPARISEITPQGDSTGRVFRARLSLSPDTVLKPGMTVEANLVTGRRENAVLVPTSAIHDGAVWTVADGRARRRAVQVGAQGVARTEITAGLKAGEKVVLDPPAKLKAGTRVKVAGA